MAGETLAEVIRRLGRSGRLRGDLAGSDAQLLDRFARLREESAFAALVARHGSMVFGLCRRLLTDAHDAEDAFQAVFLILARKAGALRRSGPLSPWLYGVAWRVAVRLRGRVIQRRRREQPGVDLDALPADDAVWSDVRRVVHEEVQRLPESYRSAIVLCCMEGKTNEEAARLLRRPVGTVKSRLNRARELLRLRLTRRGLAVTVGALGTALAVNTAPASAAIIDAAVRAALPCANRAATVAGLSVRAATLSKGVLRAMLLKEIHYTTAAVLFLALLGGVGGWAYRASAAADAPKAADHTKPAGESAKDQAPNDKADDDAKHIQGSWTAVSAEYGGKPAPPEAIKDFTIRITADTVVFNPDGENRQSTYKLHPTKSPKVIELTPQDGPAKGKTLQGLYELDGDQLKLCLQNGDGEEPTAFTTKPGTDQRLLVLKRKPAEEKPEPPSDAPAPAGKVGEKEQKLLQQWCDVAKKAFELRQKQFSQGIIDAEPVMRSAHRLLTAELARSTGKTDRIEATQAYLDHVSEMEKIAKLKYNAGKMTEAEMEDAEYYRLEAEVLLEREKAK